MLRKGCLYSFVPYDFPLSFDLPFWLFWSWFNNTRLQSASTRTHLQPYYILKMEGKKRQPETLIYRFNSIYTFNQVQRFNLVMYWQTLRPLQNLNSILAYCKTELRVSRITSPNKNLACEKAIVTLALQDARSSIHRNIWDESRRGLPGICYYYQCQTPYRPVAGSRCSRPVTFPRVEGGSRPSSHNEACSRANKNHYCIFTLATW